MASELVKNLIKQMFSSDQVTSREACANSKKLSLKVLMELTFILLDYSDSDDLKTKRQALNLMVQLQSIGTFITKFAISDLERLSLDADPIVSRDAKWILSDYNPS